MHPWKDGGKLAEQILLIERIDTNSRQAYRFGTGIVRNGSSTTNSSVAKKTFTGMEHCIYRFSLTRSDASL